MVREKFTCRDCEKISQVPTLFHTRRQGKAGPSLLATIMFEKFCPHQPLNRLASATRWMAYGRAGDHGGAVGSVCAALEPLVRLVEAHVMAAERLHAG